MNGNIIGRILLAPLSLIYSIGVVIRNMFYDANLLKSTKFNLPVISVGNLSVGGAGKTPHVEYLIRLLREYMEVSVLSRGYKRKSKGFQSVNVNDQVTKTGDEPLQFKRKYPDVTVAVCESRNIGIPMMVQKNSGIQVVLLDDAFQHRSVEPGLNILLSTFDNPYTSDYLLPAGRLREFRSASDRADIIIISKCPTEIDEQTKQKFSQAIAPKAHQKLFFSYYGYGDPYFMYNPAIKKKLTKDTKVVLLSAIANVEYLLDYLDLEADIVQLLKYEDHHYFTEREVELVRKIMKEINDPNAIILTTEKDAMRLDLFRSKIIEYQLPIFALPIKVLFHQEDGEEFDTLVKDFLLNFRA